MYYDLVTMKMDPIETKPSPIMIEKRDGKVFLKGNAGSTELLLTSKHPKISQFAEAVDDAFIVLYTYHLEKKVLVMQKSYTDPTFKTLSNAITTIWQDCK